MLLPISHGRKRMPPSADALLEAQGVIDLSPLNEAELPSSFLNTRLRRQLRIAAAYEQLAVALEQCGSLEGEPATMPMSMHDGVHAH